MLCHYGALGLHAPNHVALARRHGVALLSQTLSLEVIHALQRLTWKRRKSATSIAAALIVLYRHGALGLHALSHVMLDFRHGLARLQHSLIVVVRDALQILVSLRRRLAIVNAALLTAKFLLGEIGPNVTRSAAVEDRKRLDILKLILSVGG